MTLVTIQPDGTDGLDTQLDSANIATNYATATDFGIGERDDVGTQIYRSLIKFDLSVIPVHARIFRADLTLTISADRASASGSHRIFRCLRPWVENQATWQNYSTGNAWGTAGCSGSGSDFDATVWASVATGTADSGTRTWSLDLVEFSKMVRGEYTNNGWLLAAQAQNNDGYIYRSSNFATPADRPKLVVEYLSSSRPAISPAMMF